VNVLDVLMDINVNLIGKLLSVEMNVLKTVLFVVSEPLVSTSIVQTHKNTELVPFASIVTMKVMNVVSIFHLQIPALTKEYTVDMDTSKLQTMKA
jgi:predicted patatin/cPLA2 family phospholipase